METEFWLLDITYSLSDDEIRLYGIDGGGRRVIILDRDFHHYFYLLVGEGVAPSDVIDAARPKAEGAVLRFERVRKRLFGRPVDAVKVTCRRHALLGPLARKLRKVEGVRGVLEDDIRYSDRYLIDNDVTPCGWHRVRVEEVENRWGYRADAVYRALGAPSRSERVEPPQLRVLSFSLEYCAPFGVSSGESFVATLSVRAGGRAQRFVAEDRDDRSVLRGFAGLVADYDPDVIVGYGSNLFDWKVLMERAAANKVRIDVGRDGSGPHRSVYGHVSVAGRANVDLLNHVEREPAIKLKDLLHVARFYGIETGGIRPISPIEVPAFWRDRREELVRFSEAKTSLIHELSLRLLPFLIQFSAVIGLPLDQVVAAAVGFRVERNLMKYAYQENELIPKRERRAYAPYKGALVSGPEQGLHANIAVMDFSSMYPSLMIKYNVSPDTYVPPGTPVPEDGVHTIPEVGHRFLRSPDGFYRKVLTRLIEVRRAIRDRMGEYPPTSPVRKLLDHRQKVVKVVTNATYGYAGWIGARWYVRQVAEATTALGREAIRRAMSIAEDAGLRVLYADTDGLMVAYEPDKIREFTRRIEEEVGLRIKPDKIYDCVLFTRAKKKYAGLEPDGSLDIVGFESVRGDWAQVARDAQREAIEILLKEGSVEKVRSRLERVIRKVRGGEVPFERFIIWKTLTKPIEKYKARTPHGFAAKRLFEVGGKLEAGDKIGFVVVKGHGALYKRAVPYALASYDDIDFDYYVTKQIVPLVERCLEPFEEARRLAP